MGWERFQNANRVLNDTKGRVIFLFLFRKTKTQRTFFLFVVTFETLYLENFLELGICSNENMSSNTARFKFERKSDNTYFRPENDLSQLT